jgi:hypothetical protein
MLKLQNGTMTACLAVLLLGIPALLPAAQRVSDEELASIYGGICFNKFKCVAGNDCPSDTCEEPLEACCFCEPADGLMCSEPEVSATGPNQKCTNGHEACMAGCKKGWCEDSVLCILGDLGGPFPDCKDNSKDTCKIE